MWSRWSAAVALAAGMVVLGAPIAAQAEDPISLDGAYIVDTAEVLSSEEEARVMASIDTLYTQTDVQLFVVFVRGFTGALDAADWADATAAYNGLGDNDVLMAVAVDNRQYALSVAEGGPISDSEFDQIEVDIERELRQDRWAEAAISGSESIIRAVNGTFVAPVDGGTSRGGIPVLPILGGVAVVGVGAFIFTRIRKRRGEEAASTGDPDTLSQKQLDTRVGSLLVQVDDSLKTSEQELGFAVAQFGAKATKDFTAALASAKAKLDEAFTIKQKLDDSEPESDDERRSLSLKIIELCEAADAELDKQADAFDELRKLENNAPQALADVITATAEAREKLPAAEALLAELSSRYAASALRPVAENGTQASKLLEFAETSATAAQEAIATGKTGDAAIAVRAAQASVGQATSLFTAIEALGADLDKAAASLDALVADTTQDIAAARALPADAASTPLEQPLTAAEAALRAAEASRNDPVAAVTQLGAANLALETVFTSVQQAQARVSDAVAQLDAAIAAAGAQVRSSTEFITTRRGAVGESARTRASEADRHLQQAIALQTLDPVKALAEAQQASSLAGGAIALARNDVTRQSASERYGESEWSGGSDGADLGGILGEIVGGMLSGGSRRSSSYSRRSSSSSRSSSRSTSFGGSSRSSRRSSGGSSGGRRSRSGRF